MSEGDSDFLGRWARRKAEAREGGLRKKSDSDETPVHKPGRMRTDPPPPKQAAVDGDAVEDDSLVQEAALREEVGDESPAEETGAGDAEDAAPEDFEGFDFDKLDYDSDYTRFMKQGVPEAVRKRALRMLWGSNPILANIDGLNDYDDDFTDAALAVKGLLKTAYKPMTGYLTEEERLASYSEEARTVGSDAPKDDEETEVAEAQDVDKNDDETAGSEQKAADGETDSGDENLADEAPSPDEPEVAAAEGADDDDDEDDLGDGDGDDLA